MGVIASISRRPERGDPTMDLNQTTDTSDPGRTIGNGVVVAYSAAVAGLTALSIFGDLGAELAMIVFGAMFLVVFAGDTVIQYYDMNGYDRRGVASRFSAEAGSDEGEESDHVAAE